jgi:branched-subunit amino acid ABC-type transport system permease component
MYRISVPDVRLSFWRYFLLSWRFTLKTNPGMWLLLLPLLSVVSVVANLIARPHLLRELTNEPPIPLLIIAVALLLIPFQMYRRYRRTPLLSGCTSYELSDAGLKIMAEQQTLQLQWVALPRAFRFGHWLFLASGPQQGFFVDLRRVQAPYAPDNVLRLLRHHGIELQ